MTDHLVKAKQSWNMSWVRGKDTPLEIVVIMSNIFGLPPFLSLMGSMDKGWLGRMVSGE